MPDFTSFFRSRIGVLLIASLGGLVVSYVHPQFFAAFCSPEKMVVSQ